MDYVHEDNIENILVIDNISKNFGHVQALNKVSFNVKKGEIHSIIGENGAGKSTLVKIINGEIKQDNGNLIFNGKKIINNNPQYANLIGIVMVHQELSIFKNLTVAENMFPHNQFKNKLGFIDTKKLRENTIKNLLLFNLKINPMEITGNLTLGEQQIIEILRAVSLNRKLIILDEPTSGLNGKETDILINILKNLKAKDVAILYISHRINEILEISDNITILRNGKHITTLKNINLSEQEIIDSMVGRDVDLLYSKKEASKNFIKEEYLLEATSLSKNNSISDINFRIKKGEIVGFYGLQGSGVEKLAHLIFGLDYKDSGEIKVEEQFLNSINPHEMINRGFVYLSSNRKNAGIFFDMSYADNIISPVLKKFSNKGVINYNEIKLVARKFIEKFKISIPSVWTKAKNLSGGNQQKLMLSTCLNIQPKCLIANQPTRGVDVGAKAEVHRFLLDLPKNNNTTVILFSTEIPEIITLCDRVIILKKNKIVGELSSDNITEKSILKLATGT